MAALTGYSLPVDLNFPVGFGTTLLPDPTATFFAIDNNAGTVVQFTGTGFVYGGLLGAPSEGTITGIEVFANGNLAATISSVAVPAGGLEFYVLTSNWEGFVAEWLSGADVMTGST